MTTPFPQVRTWILFVLLFAILPVTSGNATAVSAQESLDNPGQAINERDPYGTVERGGRDIASLPMEFAQCQLLGSSAKSSNLRTELGLSAKVNESRASTARMGIFVTPSEAAFLDEGLSKRDSVDTKELSEQLSEILGNDFLGLRWNATDQKVEVFYNNDRANQKRILTIEAAIPESARRSVALSPVEMRGSRATDKELTDLASRWFEMHPKDPFILEFDQTCGKSVATIPNANRSKDMKDLLNDRLTHDFALLVDPKLEFDTISRNDFHNPHTGGLTLAIFQSGSGQLCTSSIPFRDISTGYEYVITAAHCLANHPYTGWSVKYSAGTDWYQHAGTYNSSSEIGTWSGSYYRYGANADVAWTRKKSSVLGQPKTMIHGGNHSYQGMGWWQWHPSLAIHGDPVCHSGRNWAGAVCGTIVNTNYVGSHPGVYYSGMMDSTMLGFSGDSGGTVWSPRSDGVWYMGVTSTTYVHTNWWGQTSNRMLFTHIGNVDGLHNYLDAPVGMS